MRVLEVKLGHIRGLGYAHLRPFDIGPKPSRVKWGNVRDLTIEISLNIGWKYPEEYKTSS